MVAYFSSKVSVLATKSAACALAANHLNSLRCDLGTGQGEMCGQSRYSVLTLASSENIDCRYQSVEHYHRLLGYLKAAIASHKFETAMSAREETFAAIAILSTHELMDAPGTAWKAHVGSLPLLSPAPDPSATPSSFVSIPHAAIKGSYILEPCQTRSFCVPISSNLHLYID